MGVDHEVDWEDDGEITYMQTYKQKEKTSHTDEWWRVISAAMNSKGWDCWRRRGFSLEGILLQSKLPFWKQVESFYLAILFMYCRATGFANSCMKEDIWGGKKRWEGGGGRWQPVVPSYTDTVFNTTWIYQTSIYIFRDENIFKTPPL